MTPKVLLIGWDAADWKVIYPLMDAGQMPNLSRLVERGASGPITTLHPPLSPMLWTSIATGKRPFKHGIHGFSEPTPDGRGVQAVTNLSRKSKAVWNILNQTGRRSVVIGWWPSHPAEPIDGVMVSDHYHRAGAPLDEGWPLPPNAVHPRELSEKLAGLRVHPDSLTPDLIEPFIPLAREIDQDKDKRLAACMRTVAECMSIQNAAVWLLDHQPWDFFAVYYDSIDHFCHGFMKYHPPRQSWIRERDFELYHNVVSMAYQMHDRMLGTLLQKAGEDATVVLLSDHGFHPDHLRPASIPSVPAGPAIEHRDFGILAMAGPGIKAGQRLHGSSLLDIAPTVLTVYGLPVGEDMDGKILTQAFAEPPASAFIPSWEDVPGTDGRHPPHMRLDPVAAHAALEQMVALGYIERPGDDREAAVRKTIHELRYNLGESYQDAGRHIEAHQIFGELHAAAPDDERFAVQLFVSCQALGRYEEMRRLVADSKSYRPVVADYLAAQVLLADKRYAEALAALERISEAQLLRPDLLLQRASLYLRLHRWGDAQQVYDKALELDPDNAAAYRGLCQMALRRRDYGAAAHAALDALQRVDHQPLAHFLLGLALAGMREYAPAAAAYRAALSINPNFPQAHVRLAALLEKQFREPEEAREHRRLARLMRGQKGAAESVVVVTGLPRSGTSMLMQMLAAGGMPILSDGRREADEDNPRGYLEFDPVKNLWNDSQWLRGARGKAVKIVAPLMAALPPDLPCRVLLCERDLDEVLDSQARMLLHHNPMVTTSAERRRMLKEEYGRTLARLKATLGERPGTEVLVVEHHLAICEPAAIAAQVNQFLGGGLDCGKMAAAVDPALYRNRTADERQVMTPLRTA